MLQTPDFNPKNIVQTIKSLTESGILAAQLASKGTDWQGVFLPLDESDLILERALNVQSHLNSVVFDEEFNKQYEKTLPIISDYQHQISTNKELYQAFLRLKDTQLNGQESYILSQVIQDFELSGLNLTGEKLTRYKDINAQLSLLANDFSKNSLKATDDWEKPVSLVDLGADYPKELLAKLQKDDGYCLNLQAQIYLDIITYSSNANLREEIYRAYVSRASEVGITDKKYDNTGLMGQILALRQEKSILLGFENYAQLSLSKKMVGKPDEVVDFLSNIIDLVKPLAQKELLELTKFAQKDGFDGDNLNPWDISFYSEKLKTQRYGFNQSDLRPYFPENTVFSGLFALIKQLYNVSLVQIQEKSYHPEVKVFELTDDTGVIGKIYLDIYARKNKRGGAWMSDYQGLHGEHKPIAFVVCNLNKPSNDKQGKPLSALFEFNEIVTIFHEFGHALHHLLTTVRYPSVAGINGVAWDGVELPSQMMEFFCYEKFVVDNMSKHHKTGAKLPDDLYQKLKKSLNFQSAMQLIRQCEFALWDINTHIGKENYQQVLNKVRQQTALLPAIEENRFLNTFGHIFSGGYAAGYYSYLWAEVLAADAFFHLKSQDFSAEALNSFRQNILAVGGSVDFKDQYIKFRGQMPSIEMLFYARGLKRVETQN